MKFITTKMIALLSIFTIIGILVGGVVLTGFDVYWLITGEMPTRINFLKITTIVTLTIQSITFIVLSTKKT